MGWRRGQSVYSGATDLVTPDAGWVDAGVSSGTFGTAVRWVHGPDETDLCEAEVSWALLGAAQCHSTPAPPPLLSDQPRFPRDHSSGSGIPGEFKPTARKLAPYPHLLLLGPGLLQCSHTQPSVGTQRTLSVCPCVCTCVRACAHVHVRVHVSACVRETVGTALFSRWQPCLL